MNNAGDWIRVGMWLALGLPAVILGGRWVRRTVARRLSPQQGLVAGKVVLYLGLGLLAVSVLKELGFQLTTLMGTAGIIGIAVGFASQTSVSNIISGWFLIAEAPFSLGDLVSVGETTGIVTSIDMLSVKLRTQDNRFVRIPNETLIKETLVNQTRFPIRRLELPVGIAYKEDLARVRTLLLQVARSTPVVLDDPEPRVMLQGFGNSSVDLLLWVWITRDEWVEARSLLIERVKAALDREGVEIPFPHVSLYAGSASDPLTIRVVGDPSGEGRPL
jgi:small-conductance mechanosensitive channel